MFQSVPMSVANKHITTMFMYGAWLLLTIGKFTTFCFLVSLQRIYNIIYVWISYHQINVFHELLLATTPCGLNFQCTPSYLYMGYPYSFPCSWFSFCIPRNLLFFVTSTLLNFFFHTFIRLVILSLQRIVSNQVFWVKVPEMCLFRFKDFEHGTCLFQWQAARGKGNSCWDSRRMSTSLGLPPRGGCTL